MVRSSKHVPHVVLESDCLSVCSFYWSTCWSSADLPSFLCVRTAGLGHSCAAIHTCCLLSARCNDRERRSGTHCGSLPCINDQNTCGHACVRAFRCGAGEQPHTHTHTLCMYSSTHAAMALTVSFFCYFPFPFVLQPVCESSTVTAFMHCCPLWCMCVDDRCVRGVPWGMTHGVSVGRVCLCGVSSCCHALSPLHLHHLRWASPPFGLKNCAHCESLLQLTPAVLALDTLSTDFQQTFGSPAAARCRVL